MHGANKGCVAAMCGRNTLNNFKGGKVTIAVASFPMNNFEPEYYIPAIGPLSVWVEEQKLPPVAP